MDIACANAFVVFNKIKPESLNMLSYKLLIAKRLIGCFCSRQRNPKRKLSNPVPRQRSSVAHLPKIVDTRARCHFCYNNGVENKTTIKCVECGIYLCIVPGKNARNCFVDNHA